MSDRRKILIQLDTDPLPSVFDRVVAIDAGADEVFAYGGVQQANVRDLVHGAIFTRGPKHLAHTAIFIGGSDVEAGEALLAEVSKHMLPQFGLRVSVLLDANGANTTATAAVIASAQHLDLSRVRALVLGGTGPVGRRVALLLANLGAEVRVASRQLPRASAVCDAVRAQIASAKIEPVAIADSQDLDTALQSRELVVSAGAAGVTLLPQSARAKCTELRVAIDLNAVPPVGVEGVEVSDKGVERNGVLAYGALGVGDTKMKIHKAAVARLFQSNDQVLDALEIYTLAVDELGVGG